MVKDLPPETLNKKQQKRLQVISLESSKINSIANFITKANFNLKASKINDDLVYFISDYLNEIYIFEGSVIDSALNIKVITAKNTTFIIDFRPLEITTIIDNFITNAENAGAKEIVFNFSIKGQNLMISISDNGNGIPEENVDRIFTLGFTTTTGSGIGLSIVHELVTSRMSGKLEVTSMKSPTIFRITL